MIEGDVEILRGKCPVVTMRNYHKEVFAYTSKYAKLSCMLGGYDKDHNQDKVLSNTNYDSESELENSTGSVFSSH